MFQIELSDRLRSFFSEDHSGFDELMQVDGEIFRHVKGRRTVKFERGGFHYFIKAHQRALLSEWLKCLLSLKWPVLGARAEWLGIEALERAGVKTMTLAGKGMRGWLAGSGGSFVVTESFEDSVSLEELIKQQENLGLAQRDRLKRHLIPQLGEISRRLHEGGINHRDFYLCHFLTTQRDWSQWQATDAIELLVIDLHRVQIRSGPVSDRWRIKDLGALVYSAFGADLTVADALRFIRAYHGGGADWKAHYQAHKDFWFKVMNRALGFQQEWNRKQLKEALASDASE